MDIHLIAEVTYQDRHLVTDATIREHDSTEVSLFVRNADGLHNLKMNLLHNTKLNGIYNEHIKDNSDTLCGVATEKYSEQVCNKGFRPIV